MPDAGNGRPEPERAPRPGLRDRRLGRVALLALVLLAAFVATRSCASRNQEISQKEAIAIAEDHADFTPCDEAGCVLIRAVNQGIPVRLYWLVGLAEKIGENGKPTRVQNFLVDVQTGDVTER